MVQGYKINNTKLSHFFVKSPKMNYSVGVVTVAVMQVFLNCRMIFHPLSWVVPG